MTKDQALLETRKLIKQVEKEVLEKEPENDSSYMAALMIGLHDVIFNLILEKAEAEEINREIYDLEAVHLFKPTLH